MMKNKIAYVLMGIYVILLIVGLVFHFSILSNLGTALAIFTFLYVQQTEMRKTPDEREKMIVERSGSAAFLLVLFTLLVGSIGNDFIDFLQYVNLEEIFQVLVGIGFMSFVSMYVFYSERY